MTAISLVPLVVFPIGVAFAADPDCVKARQTGQQDVVEICQSELVQAKRVGDAVSAQRALFQLAMVARTQGRFEDARELHLQIQRQPRFGEDWQAQYRLAREQGILAHTRRDPASALTLFRGALALATQHEQVELIARSYNDLGNAYRHIDSRNHALEAYLMSLERKRELGGQQIGSTLNNIADLLAELEDYHRAEQYYEEALANHRLNDHAHHIAHTLESQAALAARQLEFDRALDLSSEAFERFDRLQALPDQVRSATLSAAMARFAGEGAQADHWLMRADELAAGTDLELPALWYNIRSDRLVAANQPATAFELLQWAERGATRWPTDQRIGMLERLTDLSVVLGETELAIGYMKQANSEKLELARRHHERELAQNRVLFEVAEKQRRIDMLQSDNAIQLLELQSQRHRIVAVSLAGLLGVGMVILGAVGVQRRRTLREQQRRFALKQVLERYRQSAVALRTSQAQLQQLLDHGSEAMLGLCASNRIVFANLAACSLLELETVPTGSVIDDWFESGTWAKLEDQPRQLQVRTRQGQLLELDLEVLSLEEELQVVTLRFPEQDKDQTIGLVPLINRHFSQMQSFGSVLQAALKEGKMSGDIEARWRRIDSELKLLLNQLQPVHQDIRSQFRQDLVALMSDSLDTWEKSSGKTRVDLAENSGVWRVTIDEGRLRTRAMDRYLSLTKLPRNPRWREVLRTAYFVLGECPGPDAARLESRIERVQQQARKLGLN